MGVNIAELLPKQEIKFEDLQHKIIAVDAYNALYQFLSSIRQPDGTPLLDRAGNVTSHLQGLLSRTLNLAGRGIKLVYVFDGVPPVLKLQEQEARNSRKVAAEEKYNDAVDEEDLQSMYKYAKQFSRLNSTMVEECKQLLRALGIPVVEAPSEAEAQAAFMCRKGDVWGVASQDADALLFGTPRLLRNVTLSQKRKTSSGKEVYTFLECIELKEVLKTLDLTHDQLIVLGILVGTDFNRGGIKGIGPKKALKLLHSGDSFEMIFKKFEINFDWKEIFDLFKNIGTTSDYTLQWKPVQREKVFELLVDKHQFSRERVSNLLDKYESEAAPAQKGLKEFF